jgi:hypothetical protein
VNGNVGPSGALGVELIRGGQLRRAFPDPLAWPPRPVSVTDMLTHGTPQSGLPGEVNAWRLRNVPNLWRGARRVMLARSLRLPHFYGQLWLTLLRGDGEAVDLGLASLRVVTTTGVGFIVDAFQNSVELETMKYHALGTGTGAEASGDSALGTELTTEYSGDTRATGTTTEGASANIYRTVATVTLDSGTPAVTEHGVFSAASSGVLLDRSKFAAVNMVGASADALQVTYDLTFTAGS